MHSSVASHRPPRLPGTHFDLVVIGASAGGLNPLIEVLGALPEDFRAAVAVVLHLDPHHRSLAAEILNRKSPLRVQEAQDGDVIAAGTVYFAPPDHHLLVAPDGSLSLTQSAQVHFVRPSADLLFESAAAAYRERTLAVILSGSGRDGALGVTAVKEQGGKVLVQSPEECSFDGMPQSALATGSVDFTLTLHELPGSIVALVNDPLGEGESPNR